MENRTRDIDMSQINPNLRSIYTSEIIETLSNSIRSEGQREPIEVWFTGESFRILDGEKRWRACRKLGLTSIKAVII